MKPTRIGQVWKAIIGFLAPAAVVIGSGVAQAVAAGNAVNWWPDIIVTALVAAVVTGAGVYAKANEQPFGSDPAPRNDLPAGGVYPNNPPNSPIV